MWLDSLLFAASDREGATVFLSRRVLYKTGFIFEKNVSHTTVERLHIRFQLISCSQTRRSGENLASDGTAIATTVEILR